MTIRFITGVALLLVLPETVAAADSMELPGASGLNVSAADGLQFSPDGRWLIAAMGPGTADRPGITADRIVVWDVSTREKAAELNSPAGAISCFAVSPAGCRLATGHRDSIHVWNYEEGWEEVVPTELIGDEMAKILQQHPNLRGRNRPVRAMTFSPDGQKLAWTWEDAQIHIWSLAARQELTSLPVDVPSTSYGGNLHFVSNDNLLAMGIKAGKGYEIQLWDAYAKLRRSLPIPRGGMSSQADVSPDGQVLAALVYSGVTPERGKRAIPTELWLWDLKQGKSSRIGPGPLPMLFAPRFSPDGDTIAIGAYANDRFTPGSILLLDSGTRRPRKLFPIGRRGSCPAYLAFSPDGKQLAAGVLFDRSPVYIWQLDEDTSESNASSSR